jgi:hypothetical protein
MKCFLVALLFSSPCFAKEYHFYYRLQHNGTVNTLEYKTDAPDLAVAIERGALSCAKFFTDMIPNFDEDTKWDIFDVCLNPRQR